MRFGSAPPRARHRLLPAPVGGAQGMGALAAGARGGQGCSHRAWGSCEGDSDPGITTLFFLLSSLGILWVYSKFSFWTYRFYFHGLVGLFLFPAEFCFGHLPTLGCRGSESGRRRFYVFFRGSNTTVRFRRTGVNSGNRNIGM